MIDRPFPLAGDFEAAEYVLGNEEPLDGRSRRIRLTLPNDGWTFPSEVEMCRE